MSYGMQGPTGKTGTKVPGHKVGQIQNFTPEMMELFQGLFGHLGGGSFLSRLAGGDESLFAEMEAPAMRQFSQMQGDTASRFSGAGMGARRGSGFQNAMGQQTADFAQSLQSNRLGLQKQALHDLMSFSNMLLNQKPYETTLTKKAPGFWQSIMGALGQNAGSMPGAYMQSGGMGGLQDWMVNNITGI